MIGVPRGPGETRIGVSIQIPAPYAQDLQLARRSFGDPLAESIPPHITMVGPTVLGAEALAQGVAALADVTSTIAPFTITLRGTATFRPVSPVVFIQVVRGIAECEQLERAVRTGALAQPLRFNYHPHVTIAHALGEDALDRAFEEMEDFEASFEATSLHLFEHGDDGVWRPEREFMFGG